MYTFSSFVPKQTLINDFPEFEKIIYNITGRTTAGFITREEDNSRRMSVSFYSEEFPAAAIDFFSIPILAGSMKTIDAPNSIVLFESKARILSANPFDLVGKSIVNGRLTDGVANTNIAGNLLDGQITAIIKDPPTNTFMAQKGNTGFRYYARTDDENENQWQYSVIVKKGVSTDSLSRKMLRYNKQFFVGEWVNDMRSTEFRPLSNAFSVVHSSKGLMYLAGIFFTGLLILLTAMFNYTSFMMSHFYNRFKEGGVRKINGASAWQIFLLFYVEIAVGFLLSVLAAFILLEIFMPIFDEHIVRRAAVNSIRATLIPEKIRIQMLEYTLYGLLIFSLICIIPSRMIYRMRFITTVFAAPKGGKNPVRLTLLFFQLLILSIFMSAAFIIRLQVGNLKSAYITTMTAEEQQNILSVNCNDHEFFGNKIPLICRSLKSSPMIEDVCVSEYITDLHGVRSYREFNDARAGDMEVSPAFFGMFKGNLLQGQFFDDNSDKNDIVVNKKFAELYNGENPIGKTFETGVTITTTDKINGKEYKEHTYKEILRIVGVVEGIPVLGTNGVFADGKRKNGPVSNIAKDYPFIFRKLWNTFSVVEHAAIYIKVVPVKRQEAMAFIRDCLKQHLPDYYEVNLSNVHSDLNNTFTNEEVILLTVNIFCMVSIILGLLSIFSAVAMNTEKRRKEVAIRKINGAGLWDIIILFGKKYIVIWTFACAVAFPLIYHYSNRWLENYTERISVNIGIFIIIYLMVTALIFATIIFRILRVARLNPAEVVKSE
jgi:hypothetical protein